MGFHVGRTTAAVSPRPPRKKSLRRMVEFMFPQSSGAASTDIRTELTAMDLAIARSSLPGQCYIFGSHSAPQLTDGSSYDTA